MFWRFLLCYNRDNMSHKIIISILVIFSSLIFLAAAPAFSGVSAAQVLNTPTANADGRIIYIVKANDTCLSIALSYLNGDVNKLQSLNGLDSECVIIAGQELLLGIYEAPTNTPGPSPTPVPTLPTATSYPGDGTLCVYLFNDINGNSTPDGEEGPISGGAVVISDRTGSNNREGTTLGDGNPLCFENIHEGDYNISVGAPEGYNPTTSMNYPISVKAGDTAQINFGAQVSSAGVAQQPGVTIVEPGGNKSPILGILGAILVLGGIGLGAYFVWMKRQ
jgi:hypothetical protein